MHLLFRPNDVWSVIKELKPSCNRLDEVAGQTNEAQTQTIWTYGGGREVSKVNLIVLEVWCIGRPLDGKGVGRHGEKLADVAKGVFAARGGTPP